MLFRTVVADDVPAVRNLLTDALEADGRFEVVATAADARGALDAVAAHRPDLALVDLAMPGTSAVEVLPDMRRVSPGTIVVVVSGLPPADVAAAVAARGAAGYVEKGTSPRRLVAEVVAVAGVLETVGVALDRDLRAGAAARRFVGENLERWRCTEALDTVTLLVSELVTNAVVHARAEPDLAVVLLADRIRVEVTDDAPGEPSVRDPGDVDESGRGMALVDALASAWGVTQRGGHKTVWFEVPRFDT